MTPFSHLYTYWHVAIVEIRKLNNCLHHRHVNDQFGRWNKNWDKWSKFDLKDGEIYSVLQRGQKNKDYQLGALHLLGTASDPQDMRRAKEMSKEFYRVEQECANSGVPFKCDPLAAVMLMELFSAEDLDNMRWPIFTEILNPKESVQDLLDKEASTGSLTYREQRTLMALHRLNNVLKE